MNDVPLRGSTYLPCVGRPSGFCRLRRKVDVSVVCYYAGIISPQLHKATREVTATIFYYFRAYLSAAGE
ncbi:hypothetical protein SDC9_198987 [bioreactor metagenome]|uniref:Uncharacterized protein n=1 Tax=bioreactor metagenome TaxID=1076179 RepID=A0A645ISH9_9ZZZZ